MPNTQTEPKRARTKRRARVTKPRRATDIPADPFHVIGSDGRLCVSVALYGVRGEGLRMVVDAAAWGMIVPVYGGRWTIKEARKGYLYVIALGPKRGTRLARLVAKANPGDVVVFRDGNPLNAARGNLVTMTTQDAVARAFRLREVATSALTIS